MDWTPSGLARLLEDTKAAAPRRSSSNPAPWHRIPLAKINVLTHYKTVNSYSTV